MRRIPEVGDVWLDAGIVPFATLGWQNPAFVEAGNATGAAAGLTLADLPDHETWERWFPADWVTEMREQIRLWFYSLFFMSVVLTGRAPYRKVLTFEKLLDAEGREMHGSWGNLIAADEAFDRMGADVMRWLYCRQPPAQNIRFGYAASRRGQAPAAHVVELGALLRRLRAHRGLPAAAARSRDGRAPESSCARWTAGCRHGRSS